MHKRHVAFQCKNTAAMLFFHSLTKANRDRMQRYFNKLVTHAESFNILRNVYNKFIKTKLLSVIHRWRFMVAIINGRLDLNLVGDQQQLSASKLLFHSLVRQWRKSLKRGFLALLHNSSGQLVFKKILLRCVNIKLKSGFDMLAKNCMVDTLEQLDVTVHRAEKLESELSK